MTGDDDKPFLTGLVRIWERMAKGRPPVGTTPADVVLRENKMRLLRYRPVRPLARKPPILLVPSLINRHYVLDLLPGRSFAEWLVGQGHDVYIVDWGTPAGEDRYLTLAHFADRYLGRALRAACRRSGAESAHVLGYCLGGTLAAIHAALYPERFRSFIALAAPVGFRDDGTLSRWVRTPTLDLDALVEGSGNVPWPLMQASFHLLKPTLNLWKAVKLVDKSWDDRFLDGFFAIETWGNDNVSFPGEAYRTYIQELYREDRLLEGTLGIDGRPARLEAITCPTLAITFEHDHIVPHRSASVLLERVSSTTTEHIHMPGGHVGAVISTAAARELWPRISAFCRSAEAETLPDGEAQSLGAVLPLTKEKR